MQARISKAIMLIACASLLAACSGESPFLSKEAAKKLADNINNLRDPFHALKNVVAIINNDVYYFNLFDSVPTRLTNSPAQVKTDVKLSSDRTKIAYLNADGHPVIISSGDGKILETLTQYEYITQMGWVRNSNTLFMLIGQEVVLHGTSVSFIQPESYDPWDEVSSFSMNSKGEQAYFIHRYYDIDFKLEYHSDMKDLDETYNNFNGDLFDYVDFYDDRGNFLLGHQDNYEGGIDHVVCVQNYNFFPAYEWDEEPMQTPKFNSEHEVLLYGTLENQEYRVKAVYLGTEAYDNHGLYDRLTKILTNYPSTTPVFLDWVQ
jgi:hypothetical protein